MHKTPRGISLLETLLYVGAFVIILPATVKIFLHMIQQQEAFRARIQMEQTAGLVFTHLGSELLDAPIVSLSTSTLSVDGSSLQYINDEGQTITMDRPTTTVNFGTTVQTIHRLRVQTDSSPAVWMTPETIDVTTFRLDAVQNSVAQTTGINLDLEMAQINPTEGPARAAAFDSQTTIAFPSSVVVL